MFNISGSEGLIILIVALVVLGPESIPGLVRTAARYMHKIRMFTHNVRREISAELQLDELKNITTGSDLTEEFRSLRDDLRKTGSQLQQDMGSLNQQLNADVLLSTKPDASPEAATSGLVPEIAVEEPLQDTHYRDDYMHEPATEKLDNALEEQQKKLHDEAVS